MVLTMFEVAYWLCLSKERILFKIFSRCIATYIYLRFIFSGDGSNPKRLTALFPHLPRLRGSSLIGRLFRRATLESINKPQFNTSRFSGKEAGRIFAWRRIKTPRQRKTKITDGDEANGTARGKKLNRSLKSQL